jgi:histidinol-phosphate/aromatic aminotransferase/cobyric acid decarboxylase-like protein
MRRFLDYYRQFEELSPEEISRELRERRDAERAAALAEVPVLDLASPSWHEPPHPEIVNAATFALRRAVNAYPDPAPLREALAARHGVDAAQVAPGHGAGELLRAALRAVAPPGGAVVIAWPGWAVLPRLAAEAGAEPRPVAASADAILDAAPGAAAVVVASPNDPSGALAPLDDLARDLAPETWLIVDAALADFAPEDATARVLAARERAIVVRSFSKAQAMAGFRAGYALVPEPELADRLAPLAGVSAPAQAAMLWAVGEQGEQVVARRRALAAGQRERLAAALESTPFSFPAGHGHLAWLSSREHDGRTLAAHLAAQRITVASGSAWGDTAHVRLSLRHDAATDRLAAALAELSAA